MFRKSLTLGLFFLLFAGWAPATVYHVPDDFATIQGAINASVDGDTIVVRPGTYVENIDINRDITVESELGPTVTIIDGNQSGSVVVIIGNPGTSVVLDGFTITNGTGTDLDPDPFLNDHFGGGIVCIDSFPTMSNNIIAENIAWDPAGYGYGYGGGIYCEASPAVITDNIIRHNVAGDIAAGSFGYGGGIYCVGSSDITIHGNTVSENLSGDDGAGIACWYTDGEMINNIVVGNISSTCAGGIDIWGSDPVLTNNTVAHNLATGTGAQGGGLRNVSSMPTVTNCIFWDNFAQTDPEICDPGFASPINYCDIMGGWPTGLGNFSASPGFVGNGDYHLTWNSPCKNVGSNLAPLLPGDDFEGDPRIALGTVDVGADEFYYHLYHTGSVIAGSAIDIRVVGGPGFPVKLYLGSGLAATPYTTPHGLFYLKWPVVWQGVIGTVPGNGVLVFTVTVPAAWTQYSEHPLQALVGPYGGPFTSLTNYEMLVVE